MKTYLMFFRRVTRYFCKKLDIKWELLCELFAIGTIKRKKVVIIGTPTHSNIGDSAIVVGERNFLEKAGFAKGQILEITVSAYNRRKERLLQALHKNSFILVCLHGGGNMGDQWPKEEDFRRQVLMELAGFPMILFPQTIYYSNSETGKTAAEESIKVYNGRGDLTIVARELLSFKIMKELYPDTEIIISPDIVLSTTANQFGVVPIKRTGVLMCLRKDLEKNVDEEIWKSLENYFDQQNIQHYRTDMHSSRIVTPQNRMKIVREKMKEFCRAKLVITDRLHGMVFAAITETPCIVFGNYNHKVRGNYEWINYLPYICYAESLECAKQLIPKMISMQRCKYDNTPLAQYFDQLKEVISKKTETS